MTKAMEATRLTEIVARMRRYAPRLRGEGMTASDEGYNQTLRDAQYLEDLVLTLLERRTPNE